LQEISRNILAVGEIKKSKFIKDINDEIEYRKMCFEIFNILKEKNYKEQRKVIKEAFKKYFNLEVDIFNTKGLEEGKTNQENALNFLLKKQINNSSSVFSTIHSSKGLESTSVLVIADSNQQLKTWLDFEKANTELDDEHRLGYVAFSRARDMLCIACFEPIDTDLKEKIKRINASIV
jgi:DNA helicase II / ATP-dependent DNA helicase PcrA